MEGTVEEGESVRQKETFFVAIVSPHFNTTNRAKWHLSLEVNKLF